MTRSTEETARTLLSSIMPGHKWQSDPELLDTPKRFVRMLEELTTPVDFDFTVFDNNTSASEMVVIKDISFTTLCRHHIIPFVGHAHVAYIPDKKIAGLSKFARAVRWWARGIWTQEDLTDSIANYLVDELDPLGLALMMEAEHMCMSLRGVQAPGTKTITTQLRGVFLDPPTGRDPKGEFLEYIKR